MVGFQAHGLLKQHPGVVGGLVDDNLGQHYTSFDQHVCSVPSMTEDEYFMIKVSEECSEVSQRVTKLLRFGSAETQPGQPLTNQERLEDEFADLLAAYQHLVIRGQARQPSNSVIGVKMSKITKWLKYSRECGVVTSAPSI
jgi:hypothetical protein